MKEKPSAANERREAADLIRRFVRGGGSPHEWDDFIGIPFDDQTLERARLESVRLPEVYPPEQKSEYCSEAGRRRLMQLADELDGTVNGMTYPP